MHSQQYQHVTDSQSFDMGSGEINVAFHGTYDDLNAAEDVMFSMNDGFAFSNQVMGSTDGFTPINDVQTQGVTVSPRDIFNSDSVPPSTSFTNLTTPGSTFLETPDEDYQTSPLFSDTFGDTHHGDNWYPLFPEETHSNATATPAPVMARTTSASSNKHIVVHPGGESHNRKRSVATASPATFASPLVKHSNVAGVNARKRDKPLPPIVVSDDDPIALKRARNTAAARKSRAKKVQERDELEGEIADLKAQVEHWKSLALALQSPQQLADD